MSKSGLIIRFINKNLSVSIKLFIILQKLADLRDNLLFISFYLNWNINNVKFWYEYLLNIFWYKNISNHDASSKLLHEVDMNNTNTVGFPLEFSSIHPCLMLSFSDSSPPTISGPSRSSWCSNHKSALRIFDYCRLLVNHPLRDKLQYVPCYGRLCTPTN